MNEGCRGLFIIEISAKSKPPISAFQLWVDMV